MDDSLPSLELIMEHIFLWCVEENYSSKTDLAPWCYKWMGWMDLRLARKFRAPYDADEYSLKQNHQKWAKYWEEKVTILVQYQQCEFLCKSKIKY